MSTFLICIVATVLFVFNCVAYAGTSIETAKAIGFGTTYSDSITETNREDYYKITLASSGRLTIKMTSYMQYYCLYLYNEDGVEVWYEGENEWVSTTNKRSDTVTVDLIKGKYYLKVDGYYNRGWKASTGNYDFNLAFKSAEETAIEPNNSILEAKSIDFNKTINGQIAVNDENDYYILDLASAGRITINFNSYMQYYCLYLYNEDGIELWYDGENEWASTTGKRSDTITVDLTEGKYYLKVDGYYNRDWKASTGNYNFKISFKSAEENFSEPNNSTLEAKSINFNKTVNGQIAINDTSDYYILDLASAGRITISFNSYMQYYCLYLYNEDGIELWYDGENEWASTTGKRSDTITVDLTKGKYYLKVDGYYNRDWKASTGNYNFKISFKSAGESFKELNDTIIDASPINFNKTIKGQIATNDINDYYVFNLVAAGKITIKFNSYMQYYCLTLYNEDGSEFWYDGSNEWVSTTGKRSDTITIDLTKGKYYLKVDGYYNRDWKASTGNYNFTVSPEVNVAKVTNLKSSSSTSTIKLSWSKNSGVSGYVVYKYNSSTKKYEKIVTTKSNSYTFKNLKNGTTYKFKVRAYKKAYDKTYYGEYATLATATKPATPTIKLSTSKNSATVTWDKISGATGYVVYMSSSKDGTYNKISTTTKTSIKKSGLTKGKTQYFKVRAYKKVDGKYIYGSYSAVKSIKIK